MPRFQGLFGLWPFPIINAILEILSRRTLISPPQFSNIEEIEWTDWAGRTRTIKIHREVR